MQVDASGESAAFDCPSGQGTVALMGGSSIYAFGALSKNGGDWAVHELGTETVGASTALVPYGGGFLSLWAASLSEDIESSLETGAGAWSDPIQLNGTAGPASEQRGPSLAVLGANAELVYQATNSLLYHAEYSAGTWGLASDQVGGGADQDGSPTQPSCAASNGTLYAAFDGDDAALHVDTWTAATGWENEVVVNGAVVDDIPPTIVALTSSADGGGSPDLMVIFIQATTHSLFSSVHTPGAGAGTWGPVQQVSAGGTTYDQVALAPLPGGGAEMVYQGEDGYPYATTYAASGGGTWSAPVSLEVAGTLQSPPSVAIGVCGYDAVAAIVEASGVELATLKSGVWSTPVRVTGLSSVTYASIATSP